MEQEPGDGVNTSVQMIRPRQLSVRITACVTATRCWI